MHVSRTFSSFAVVAIILLYCTHLMDAGFTQNMSERDKTKLKDIVSGKLEIPAELEIFVKYMNKQGKRYAKRWAKDGKVIKNMPKRNILSIRPCNRTAVKRLSKYPHIEYIEPVHKVRALNAAEPKYSVDSIRNLRRESVGYGIEMIQASQLWDIPNATDITICIIDSGYDLGHPDLPVEDVTGTSTNRGKWDEDIYGHGTHCAGIIGAIGYNNRGVVGVINDPTKFKLHIGKGLDSKGVGSEVDVLTAFQGCVDVGAKVISMSLGIDDYSQTVHDTTKNAYDEGILMVAAAGNDGGPSYSYPASYPYISSVSAVDRNGNFAPFSQYNDQIELAGPGVNIESTVPTNNNGIPNGVDVWSGTSMASAYVAGVAAAVWSHFPECSNNQIRNALVRTAKRREDAGCSHEFGYGIVQAKDAYDLLVKEGCESGDVSPIPLSDGAVGGCEQDPEYVPPPTAAPTFFVCTENVFLLELKTDEYGEETTWDIVDSQNNTVSSGGPYMSSRDYTERICLPDDIYVFTMRDSQNDGICCDFSEGRYSVQYNGVLVKTGGDFEGEESVFFGQMSETSPSVATNSTSPTSSPQSSETPSPEVTSPPTLTPTAKLSRTCKDDKKWMFKTNTGKEKRCKYLLVDPSVRCKKMGLNSYGALTSGYDSCARTCGMCGSDNKAEEVSSPTAAPTTSPKVTLLPTHAPIITRDPTTRPTGAPTLNPTRLPTPSPTQPPTVLPKASPPPTVAPKSKTNTTPEPECIKECCYPDKGSSSDGYPNDYMLGICAAKGCHYNKGINGRGPLCSGKDYYYQCASECGATKPPTTSPPPSTDTVTPLPSLKKGSKFSTPSPTDAPFPLEKQCVRQCCFPIDSRGNGGNPDMEMLDVCRRDGCRYIVNENDEDPYCFGKGFFDECLAYHCGITVTIQTELITSPPTPQTAASPTAKLRLEPNEASLQIHHTVALAENECPSVQNPKGAGHFRALDVEEDTDVVWCFKIINTGTIPLSQVNMNALDIGLKDQRRGLRVGQSWYIQKRWRATESIESTGETWGYFQEEKRNGHEGIDTIIPHEKTGTVMVDIRVDAVPSTASISVIKKQKASLSISKTVALRGSHCPSAKNPTGKGDLNAMQIPKEGTEVVWCFKITNTGMAPLSPLRLMDLPISFSKLKHNTLGINESWYIKTRWNATSSLTNEAQAWGYIQKDNDGNKDIKIQQDIGSLERVDAEPDSATVIIGKLQAWNSEPTSWEQVAPLPVTTDFADPFKNDAIP